MWPTLPEPMLPEPGDVTGISSVGWRCLGGWEALRHRDGCHRHRDDAATSSSGTIGENAAARAIPATARKATATGAISATARE